MGGRHGEALGTTLGLKEITGAALKCMRYVKSPPTQSKNGSKA